MNTTANLPKCPACQEDMTYPDGENFVCAQCGHEWPMTAAAEEDEGGLIVKDANGNLLADGDTVTLIKDLKVKGSSTTLKVGTKIKVFAWFPVIMKWIARQKRAICCSKPAF